MSNDNRNNTQNEYKYHTVFVLLDWLERFSRTTQATMLIEVTKNFVCQNKFVFNILSWQKSLKIITSIMCDLDNRNKSFFPVVKSEINCPSDGLVKTTKSSFPFLLLLTNQLAGFTAPILSRFAYFCHPTTIICNLSTLNSL